MRLLRQTYERTPWLTVAMGLAIVCTLVNFFWNDKMGSDTAAYYTRMASQFGQGNYDRAFFHSMPPLVPALAGIFCKLGLSSWQAMKLVSGVFFILAAYWSYKLGRLRLDAEKAQWCAMLFVCCSRLLRYGMAGQLDSAKMFFILVAVEQTLRYLRDQRWRNLIFASIASGLLALSRNEGIISIPLICFLMLTAPLGLKKQAESSETLPGIKRIAQGVKPCVVLLTTCLIIWSPWIMYQYKVTGYPSISSKLTIIAERIFNLEKSEVTKANEAHEQYILQLQGKESPETSPASAPSQSQSFLDQFDEPEACTTPYKLIETWKGIVPYLFFPAIFGAWLLLKRKNWQPFDTAMAIAFAGHLILLWLFAPNILKRLVVPYIPFYFTWVITCATAAYDYLATHSKTPTDNLQRRLRYVLIMAIVIMAWDGMSSLRGTLRGKVDTEHEIAQWIREQGDALDVNKADILKSTLTLGGYHSSNKLVIASHSPTIPSLVDSDWFMIGLYSELSLTQELIYGLLMENHVDILLTNPDFQQAFPNFDSRNMGHMVKSWNNGKIKIIEVVNDISNSSQ